MDLRLFGGDINRIRALAQELVGLHPDIIMTESTPATVALQLETRTMALSRGSRPGGNVTGFAGNEDSLGGKWLELLSEIAPLKRAAVMFNPDTAPASTYMPSFETAARLLKVVPIIAPVHSDVEIEAAIIALGREPGTGLVVLAEPFTVAHRASIMLAAARNNVPAVYCESVFARDGGLLSYGPDLVDPFRRAATYALREAQFRFHPRHRAGRPCQAGIFASSSGSRKA